MQKYSIYIFFPSLPVQQNTAWQTTNETEDRVREVCGALEWSLDVNI